MSKVIGGRFYGVKANGESVEIPEPSKPPDVWICRRVVDFPDGKLPASAHLANCVRCNRLVAYNPARKFVESVPKVCMQCDGITPDPIP